MQVSSSSWSQSVSPEAVFAVLPVSPITAMVAGNNVNVGLIPAQDPSNLIHGGRSCCGLSSQKLACIVGTVALTGVVGGVLYLLAKSKALNSASGSGGMYF